LPLGAPLVASPFIHAVTHGLKSHHASRTRPSKPVRDDCRTP
jgi:hypothetical protein